MTYLPSGMGNSTWTIAIVFFRLRPGWASFNGVSLDLPAKKRSALLDWGYTKIFLRQCSNKILGYPLLLKFIALWRWDYGAVQQNFHFNGISSSELVDSVQKLIRKEKWWMGPTILDLWRSLSNTALLSPPSLSGLQNGSFGVWHLCSGVESPLSNGLTGGSHELTGPRCIV